ncbi:hypothetical protein [Metabacillus halosaccharovorans]|uniref:DUF4878 domain-containing protein n=1 Tax=Metabacillus halosaccharovorans TaxID=930124 RepID=A0ABT3DCI8_9BACI|nr:hypothetical protein [Metabacillus halosaccharovorans]MCV9884767.1 hypothetical protein [Metabacillus halosaccharovorans]
MRRRRKNAVPLVIVIILLIILIVSVRLFLSFANDDPEDIVSTFYHYEQEGDFGSAWELFHLVLQERFSKNAYVTERSHIYMSHYGVTTFEYEIVEEEEIQNWKMAEDQETFPTAYKMTVEQKFKSKFGTFTILQDVYAVQHEGEWRIVWEY